VHSDEQSVSDTVLFIDLNYFFSDACVCLWYVCLQVLVGMLQISSFMNFATPTVSNLIDLDLMLNSQSVSHPHTINILV